MTHESERNRGARTGRRHSYTVRLNDDLHARVVAEAEGFGESRSAVMQRLIIAGLENKAAERRHQEVMAELRRGRRDPADYLAAGSPLQNMSLFAKRV